jgi:mannose-6-phosphate isomerase-like protein (cupin superfamily)
MRLLLPCFMLISSAALAAQPAVIVNEKDVVRDEAPPHGAIGMSTVYRLADQAANRTMEFRKRTLHVGAALGVHTIDHDEVYYVLAGEGVLTSAGKEAPMKPGMAAYLYRGDAVGLRQIGSKPLTIIVSYPLPGR